MAAHKSMGDQVDTGMRVDQQYHHGSENRPRMARMQWVMVEKQLEALRIKAKVRQEKRAEAGEGMERSSQFEMGYRCETSLSLRSAPRELSLREMDIQI